MSAGSPPFMPLVGGLLVRAFVVGIAGPAVLAFEPEGYDELDPTADPVRLRLTSTAVWRTRAVQQLHDAVVRAAPVGPREWVLTAGSLPTLYGARAVRRH